MSQVTRIYHLLTIAKGGMQKYKKTIDNKWIRDMLFISTN